MNRKYRVKIETLNNGDKEYIPQVGLAKFKIFGKGIYFDWFNILGDYQNTSKIMSHHYKTEENAIDVIDCYKKFLHSEEGKKVIKTTFKNIIDE